MPIKHGEQHYSAKLTDQKVQLIRDTYKPGEVSYTDLAESYGVNKSTISRIIAGTTWKHLASSTTN
ncbi:hypothetical protein [Glutamicibacter sp. NPDC127525]|uniref:hypothetical protein n=1 Tax=unclassified Glutamicibacter TaxID=2627139 RepID=UPI003640A64B